MVERYPRLRQALPAAALGAALLTGCGSEKQTVQEKPDITSSAHETAKPPTIPTPRETGSRLKQKEFLDGTPALVCNALAAIVNPDKTKRIIAQPIVWNSNKAPVEIMNMSSSGIVVEERDKMPMEWYSMDGKEISEKDVDCASEVIFTAYNKTNNNQVIASVPTVEADFKADFHRVHDGTLVQHDFGPYRQTETDELLQQLQNLS